MIFFILGLIVVLQWVSVLTSMDNVVVTVVVGAASSTDQYQTIIDEQDMYKEGDIRIIQSTGKVQILPSVYTKNLQRWVLLLEQEGNQQRTLEPIKIPSMVDKINVVDPTSTTSLWWPADISKMEARSTLDIMIWKGKVQYISGGLDIRVVLDSRDGGGNKIEWRNHGLHSAPLAMQWLPYESASLPNFRVQSFLGTIKLSDDKISEKMEWQWEHLDTNNEQTTASAATRNALERFGFFWSSTSVDYLTTEGYHVVSIPLDQQEWTSLPSPHDGTKYLITSLASAQSDEMMTLLSSPPTTTSSIVAVQVVPVAAGSESEHLPQGYKDLYS